MRNIEDDVNAALGTLLPRERNVLRLRYGMHDKEEGLSMTLCDVSAAYGLSKERIRQIEDRAITKLKVPWRTRILEHSLVHQ
jgi:RNA polymerase sigma factor (sigma-70 family)